MKYKLEIEVSDIDEPEQMLNIAYRYIAGIIDLLLTLL